MCQSQYAYFCDCFCKAITKAVGQSRKNHFPVVAPTASPCQALGWCARSTISVNTSPAVAVLSISGHNGGGGGWRYRTVEEGERLHQGNFVGRVGGSIYWVTSAGRVHVLDGATMEMSSFAFPDMGMCGALPCAATRRRWATTAERSGSSTAAAARRASSASPGATSRSSRGHAGTRRRRVGAGEERPAAGGHPGFGAGRSARVLLPVRVRQGHHRRRRSRIRRARADIVLPVAVPHGP